MPRAVVAMAVGAMLLFDALLPGTRVVPDGKTWVAVAGMALAH